MANRVTRNSNGSEGGTPALPFNSSQYNNGGVFGAVPLNTSSVNFYLQQTSSGAPVFAQVSDADLSVTNITTNNVTNAHHGFFPTLTANRVYYVNNSGVLTALALGTSGTFLKSNGATSPPTFAVPTTSPAWNLTGNAGTTPGTNFVGTTDGASLYFKVGSLAGEIDGRTNGNVFLGLGAGAGYAGAYATIIGLANIGIGYNAMNSIYDADNCIAIGNAALFASVNTQSNVAIGSNSLTGALYSNNTAIGYNSLASQVIGANNTAIGYGADNPTDYSNSFALGYNSVIYNNNQLAVSDTYTLLYMKLNTGSSGYILTTDGAGNASWQVAPASAVTSVSNIDGTLTISPTTGAVVASIALGHANSWSALQTFGNNISFGGAQLNVTSITTGNLLQYNGTNWVNVTVASLGFLSSTLTNTHIFVGNASNVATDVAMSGDATIANTGALTIANNAITTAKINNSAVTYAKIQNMSASTLLGNPTGSSAAPSEITLGTGLSFSGSVLNSTGSGITRSVNSVATNTNAGATANTDYVYFCSTAMTLTLPTAVGNTNRYSIKKTDSGATTVTVATTSSQTIDGSTTALIKIQYASVDLISDGSNWNIV